MGLFEFIDNVYQGFDRGVKTAFEDERPSTRGIRGRCKTCAYWDRRSTKCGLTGGVTSYLSSCGSWEQRTNNSVTVIRRVEIQR